MVRLVSVLRALGWAHGGVAEIRDLRVRFGAVEAVRGVSLAVVG